MTSAHLLVWIHQYGYAGLAAILVLGIVGLPLPDETILTAVGYLIYRGHLAYVPSLVAGVLGGCVGITLSYVVGARVGRPLLLRLGRYVRLTEQRMERVEHFFAKYGSLSLIIGFFVPGVRHLTAIVAGVGGMTYRRFAIAAYTGVCLWVTAFITLGRFAGPQLEALRESYPVSDLWLAAGLAGLLCASGFGLWWEHRRRSR